MAANNSRPGLAGPVIRLLAWLGGHERGVLVGMLLIVAGVWLFVALADEVREGETETIDRALLLAMRNPDGTQRGSERTQSIARDLTALGGGVVLGLLTAVVGGYLILDGKTKMALYVWIAVATGALLTAALKQGFERPRPDLVPHAMPAVGASFPSGHSSLSAVTYLTLGALLARSEARRRVKAYLLLVAIAITVAVGVTRVYLGVHWPSDVLGGWTIGSVWAVSCWTGARWLQSRRRIESEG